MSMILNDLKKECPWCGKEFTPVSGHRKYCCDDCAYEANKESIKRLQAEKRQHKKMFNAECLICHKVFLTTRHRQKTCSLECQNERMKELHRKNNANHKIRQRLKKEREEAQKKVETIAEIQRKAREMGLSYGKYMELRQTNRI
jgi:hypothetical protein